MYKVLLIAKRNLVILYTRYANSVLASLEPRRSTRKNSECLAILLTVMLVAHVTLSPEAKRFHVWNSSRYGFDACRYDPMECWAEGETTKTQEKKSDRLLL